MSPHQAQPQSPQPGQTIRESQLDKDKGQDGRPHDESPNQDHLMEEGDGIPGGNEESDAPDVIPGEGSDARRTEDKVQRP